MQGLAGLARGLGRRRSWSVLLASQQGAEYFGNRAQAAGIAAAAGGRNGDGSGGGSGSEAPLQLASPGRSPPTRLDKLRERFRVGSTHFRRLCMLPALPPCRRSSAPPLSSPCLNARPSCIMHFYPARILAVPPPAQARARANDALGAEMYLRQYIQEGGEPQARAAGCQLGKTRACWTPLSFLPLSLPAQQELGHASTVHGSACAGSMRLQEQPNRAANTHRTRVDSLCFFPLSPLPTRCTCSTGCCPCCSTRTASCGRRTRPGPSTNSC